MTHRRRVLKAALAAPAMIMPEALRRRSATSAAGAAPPEEGGALFDLYTDWLAYQSEMEKTAAALGRAEEAALAEGSAAWNAFWDAPPLGSGCAAPYTARHDALYAAQRRTLFAMAATPATSLDDIAVKLALWRRANPDLDAAPFADMLDALAFSAYLDAVALAGGRALLDADDDSLRASIRLVTASSLS